MTDAAGKGFAAVVLAAGKGTRMCSERPKVLHRVCGRPMVQHVVACAVEAGAERVLVVIGHGADDVRECVESAPWPVPVSCVVQEEQLGTGHAVGVCREALAEYGGAVLILNGDVPLVTPVLVTGLLAAHWAAGGGITVVTVELDDPTGYGRMLRRPGGDLERVVEQKDATPTELAVHEVNTGIYAADPKLLFPLLARVSADNAQGEYYLTDIVGLALRDGNAVHVFRAEHPEQVLGVNSRAELARVTAVMRRRINDALMAAGVTFIDPERTYVDTGVRVGSDTVIHPGVTLEGNTVIGSDCTLYPDSRIADSRVGDGVEVRDHCLITGADLEGGNVVGPSAHLRPGARLMRGARVGNFVEIKQAVIGAGSKVNHLSYVGDAAVGADVNIGAGTITCNYDGVRKHRTEIGDGAFIGSDTQLVAPVRVGKGAVVGAGSTITGDVPDGALALSRVPQKNVDDWAERKGPEARKKREGG